MITTSPDTILGKNGSSPREGVLAGPFLSDDVDTPTWSAARMMVVGVAATVKAEIIHVMYDGYEGNPNKLADVEGVYNLCYTLAKELGIGGKEALHVIPYFKGLVPEDSGVSALFVYPQGHFTVHTFDQRGTVFVDFAVIGKEIINPSEAIQRAMRSTFEIKRDETFVRGTNPIDDPAEIPAAFGPHLTFSGQLSSHQMNLDWIYDFLEKIPKAIGMTPIAPPRVIRSTTPGGLTYRDGMAVIAESHITIHVDDSGVFFFDIFSCKAFDVQSFMQWAESFGLMVDIPTITLAARGKDFPR